MRAEAGLNTPIGRAWLGLVVATMWPAVLEAQPLSAPLNGGDTLLCGIGDDRSTLDEHGISLGLQSTDEVFGNPNGGRAQGATCDGQTALGLGIDLEKAIGHKGGIFNVSAFQDYGHGISASYIDNLLISPHVVSYFPWHDDSSGFSCPHDAR